MGARTDYKRQKTDAKLRS